MKTAAKVFLIIGMILQFFLIFPIILGVIALGKLESGSKEEVRTWGIISIFGVSLIGGIFMLLSADDEVKASLASEGRNKSGQFTSDSSDPASKLRELKGLYDQGIIDETTYLEKRRKYMEAL